MKKRILIITFLVLLCASTAWAIKPNMMLMLFSGGGVEDTTSYVYFGADRVVFGADPITI